MKITSHFCLSKAMIWTLMIFIGFDNVMMNIGHRVWWKVPIDCLALGYFALRAQRNLSKSFQRLP